jgi:hypothetical protein
VDLFGNTFGKAIPTFRLKENGKEKLPSGMPTLIIFFGALADKGLDEKWIKEQEPTAIMVAERAAALTQLPDQMKHPTLVLRYPHQVGGVSAEDHGAIQAWANLFCGEALNRLQSALAQRPAVVICPDKTIPSGFMLHFFWNTPPPTARDDVMRMAQAIETALGDLHHEVNPGYVAPKTEAESRAELAAWFTEAVDRMVAIYKQYPNHGSHDSAAKGELEDIGRMLDEKGGIKMMRAAHAEFTSSCKIQNIRDASGYISAPRSLEYIWSGIGSWMG